MRIIVAAAALALVSLPGGALAAKAKPAASGKVEYLRAAVSPPMATRKVTAPRDAATGQATGKRSRKPSR